MSDHPINSVMNSAMENLKQMVEVDTIIGDAITSPDGTVIIPVSKVSFGLAAGGGEYVSKNKTSPEETKPFAGGVGAGVTISPIAFLAVNEKNVRLLPVNGDEPVSKLIDYIPVMVDKISNFITENKKEKEATTEE